MPAVLAWCVSPGILESQHSSCAQGQAGVQELEPCVALGSSAQPPSLFCLSCLLLYTHPSCAPSNNLSLVYVHTRVCTCVCCCLVLILSQAPQGG